MNERTNKVWLHPDFVFKRSECYKKLSQHKETLKDYVADVYDTKRIEYFKNKNAINDSGILSV